MIEKPTSIQLFTGKGGVMENIREGMDRLQKYLREQF